MQEIRTMRTDHHRNTRINNLNDNLSKLYLPLRMQMILRLIPYQRTIVWNTITVKQKLQGTKALDTRSDIDRLDFHTVFLINDTTWTLIISKRTMNDILCVIFLRLRFKQTWLSMKALDVPNLIYKVFHMSRNHRSISRNRLHFPISNRIS